MDDGRRRAQWERARPWDRRGLATHQNVARSRQPVPGRPSGAYAQAHARPWECAYLCICMNIFVSEWVCVSVSVNVWSLPPASELWVAAAGEEWKRASSRARPAAILWRIIVKAIIIIIIYDAHTVTRRTHARTFAKTRATRFYYYNYNYFFFNTRFFLPAPRYLRPATKSTQSFHYRRTGNSCVCEFACVCLRLCVSVCLFRSLVRKTCGTFAAKRPGSKRPETRSPTNSSCFTFGFFGVIFAVVDYFRVFFVCANGSRAARQNPPESAKSARPSPTTWTTRIRYGGCLAGVRTSREYATPRDRLRYKT